MPVHHAHPHIRLDHFQGRGEALRSAKFDGGAKFPEFLADKRSQGFDARRGLRVAARPRVSSSNSPGAT